MRVLSPVAQGGLIAAAENGGLAAPRAAVRRYGGVPPYAETQGYVRTGLRVLRALSR